MARGSVVLKPPASTCPRTRLRNSTQQTLKRAEGSRWVGYAHHETANFKKESCEIQSMFALSTSYSRSQFLPSKKNLNTSRKVHSLWKWGELALEIENFCLEIDKLCCLSPPPFFDSEVTLAVNPQRMLDSGMTEHLWIGKGRNLGWWSRPMGVQAKGTPKGCHGELETLHPQHIHYQVVKPLLSRPRSICLILHWQNQWLKETIYQSIGAASELMPE